ncbi:MAG: thioredoxin domain-containing protein [Patescibacteria group bacterium]
MKTSSIPLAIVAGGIIIAGAIYLAAPRGPVATEDGDPRLVRPVTSADHILGNPTAQAFIIEYSDIACDFCKDFHTTMRQLMTSESASGKVAWVFRHFPLTEIHPTALSLARATECAASVGGNEMFWKFTDALYAKQPVDPSTLGSLASSVGISGTAFASCYATASSTIEARIQADRQNALDIGAQGTPYSLIVVPGKAPVVVDGAYPYDSLKLLLDNALSN